VGGVISVHLDDLVRIVAQTLNQNRIHAVSVVTKDGAVVGVISEIDVIGTIDEDIDTLKAEDIMCSSCIRTITPQSPLIEAAKMMREIKCHRLLIMGEDAKDDVAVGVLSASDIVAEMAKNN